MAEEPRNTRSTFSKLTRMFSRSVEEGSRDPVHDLYEEGIVPIPPHFESNMDGTKKEYLTFSFQGATIQLIIDPKTGEERTRFYSHPTLTPTESLPVIERFYEAIGRVINKE